MKRIFLFTDSDCLAPDEDEMSTISLARDLLAENIVIELFALKKFNQVNPSFEFSKFYSRLASKESEQQFDEKFQICTNFEKRIQTFQNLRKSISKFEFEITDGTKIQMGIY